MVALKKSTGHYGHYYTDQKNKSVVIGLLRSFLKVFCHGHVYRVIEIIIVFQNQIEIYVFTERIGFRECLLLFLHYEIEPVMLFFSRIFIANSFSIAFLCLFLYLLLDMTVIYYFRLLNLYGFFFIQSTFFYANNIYYFILNS